MTPMPESTNRARLHELFRAGFPSGLVADNEAVVKIMVALGRRDDFDLGSPGVNRRAEGFLRGFLDAVMPTTDLVGVTPRNGQNRTLGAWLARTDG